MKKVKEVLNNIEDFLYKIVSVISKGFFFYFALLAELLHKVFPLSIFEKSKLYFKKKQEDATAFLFIVVIFLVGVNVYVHFYNDSEIKYVSNNIQMKDTSLDNTELNLFKRYSKLNINNKLFKKIKKDNMVSWITVDGTNINYPVVQGEDNSFYLNHDVNKNLKSSGWIFMDYRNSKELDDDNTIIYGHNLANKTSFGSLSNVFKSDWFETSNHYIEVITEKDKYVYEIFSIYTIDPEVYYLQNNFNSKDSYKEFISTIKSRSIYDFNIDLDTSDRIITLSTCTDNNKSRNVVHAKLIK